MALLRNARALKPRRLFLGAVLAVGLLGPVTSWAQLASNVSPAAWDATVAAAKKEGKVVLYANTVVPLDDRIRADFQAAYPGIALEYTRIVGAPLISRITQEQQGGLDGADAVLTYELGWLGIPGNPMIKPFDGPSARSWPSKYWVKDGVPLLAVEPCVIAYNTDYVKTEITGYRDLLRPEFKGKIGTPGLVATVLVAWYDWMEHTLGSDFLPKLASQDPKFYVGAFPITQATASGEAPIGAFSLLVVANPLIASGAHIKVVIPNPALGTAWGGAMLTASHRPNAAKVFLNYIMSERGQTIIHGQGESASPLPNIKNSQNIDDIVVFDPSKYPSDVVKAYTEKWNTTFNRHENAP